MISPTLVERIRGHAARIYPDCGEAAADKLLSVCDRYAPNVSREQAWSERDVWLIAYGDQVSQDAEPPLETLHRWLLEHGLREVLSTVHILPFFPYSSDDGFSVVDYREVDPQLGTWSDIQRLGRDFHLMFDLVLNHVSQHSDWFRGYLTGDARYRDYFLEVPPGTDVSQVTRPRSLPLLTRFNTARGPRDVWTTFSRDQIDLNFGNPAVLANMLDVLLFYIQQGARAIRLDAIAYLWKELGTDCIHLPRTHEVVKLLRTVVDHLAPQVLLLTETNVPHRENVSYFGEGDEAHLVYQFSLPPLLLDALLQHDGSRLTEWLANLESPIAGTSYLNFTASHDGIGVRPLEGLVPEARLRRLLEEIRTRGGLVSTRRRDDGEDAPYELNITYFDALRDVRQRDPDLQIRPFLASQAVMLSLQGIPAVYFHSLVGTPNDIEGVQKSSQPRRINRRKFLREELNGMLQDPASTSGRVFRVMRRMLEIRRAQPAFHPAARQEVVETSDAAVLAFVREAPGKQNILVAANFSPETRTLQLCGTSAAAGKVGRRRHDLLSGDTCSETMTLRPFQVAWLATEDTR